MSDARVGTFTPDPGAAPLPRQVLAQASMEARLMVRNGEQLLLAIVIPVLVLVGGVAGAHRVGIHFDERAVGGPTPRAPGRPRPGTPHTTAPHPPPPSPRASWRSPSCRPPSPRSRSPRASSAGTA